MGYMTNFLVYVFAMVGVIMLALLVFKQATGCKTKISGGKSLKVIDTLNLTPRKTLYVISVGKEKFLIAGDAERTSLISKLESIHDSKNESYAPSEIITNNQVYTNNNFKDTMRELSIKDNYMDKNILGINSTKTSPYDSVIKSLAEKIRG